MRKSAFFFRIGEFSLINDAVGRGLRAEFEELEWRTVDVEKEIVRSSPLLLARATAESIVRYGRAIAANRQPPRDFFPRIPAVLAAIGGWVRANVDPARTAFIFQTQSLFDARHPGLPHFVYTDHTYLANRRYAEPKPLLPVADAWRRMERELYAGASCNFVSSGFAAESLREDYGVGVDQVEVVFSGTNIRGGEPAARSGNVILFVGVDWERKGGPELVEAFRKVRATLPQAELWVVGCEPGVNEPGIRIFGRVAPAAVADCYAKADVFCLPSRMDPSASVLAEASAYELPIVATRVGGNSERVEDGVTGFLCEPHELAARLIQLLQSSELRHRMGLAGRGIVSERFTWEAVCARMASRMRKDLSC